MSTAPPQVFVESEWAELKECIYGWTGEFIWPKFLQDAELRPSGGVRKLWFENQERDVAEACPEFLLTMEDAGRRGHPFPRGERGSRSISRSRTASRTCASPGARTTAA